MIESLESWKKYSCSFCTERVRKRLFNVIERTNFIDVHSDGPKAVFLQAFDYGGGVDKSTTGGIDENDALLHLTDCPLIDDMLCGIKKWAMDRDDVGTGK